MKPLVETHEHKAASNELLSRFLPAMGMETKLREVTATSGVPVAVLIKWTGRAASLSPKHFPAINAWIESRTAVRA